MEKISIQRLKEVLNYNENTGIFAWKYVRSGVRSTSNPGYKRKDGYIMLTIDKNRILAHRAAIALATGKWPIGCVDHIDGDPTNNAISNLRDVCQQTNLQNIKSATKRNKSSGILGVSFHNRDKLWRARIYVNGKTKTWYSKDKDKAQRIYLEAKRLLHEGCTL